MDSAEESETFIRKIARDGGGELDFPLLSDPNGKVIKAYGLVDPRYIGGDDEGIPHPAIYLLDKNRKVLWAKVEMNYRQRPSFEEVQAEITKRSGKARK